ncbi:MAG: YcaO-related McrA-glycine thioamidation protein [Methanomicrobiales archaeon]|nr:YcaO-related McrA-glycine thioamidation protein [Methanomicrobiales archaeon]
MRYTLRRVQKHYFDGTHRVKSPDETLSIVEPLMEQVGVEEVVNITHVDRLGIPCFTAFRPRAARGGVRHHAGKGKDPVQAKVSSLMEAVERYSGEYHGDAMEFASYEEIGSTRAVDPEDLFLPRPLEPGEKLHWSPCYDLLHDEELFIPSNAVFHPYDTRGMTMPLFASDTNGLASGNVMEEAILHALLEVVERDAMSMAEQARSMGTRLDLDAGCPAKDVQDRFLSSGIEIHLWVLDGRTGIPTVAAAGDDTVTRDPGLLVIGSGTHPDPAIAALRALTELAQSRASYLHGGRENLGRRRLLEKAGYDRLKRINREWFADAPSISLASLENRATPFIDDDIRILLEELRPHVKRVCVCDLSRTGIPVVRVIVPGLEVSHVNRERVRRKRQGR